MSKIKNIIFDLGGVILLQPKELMHTLLKEVFPDKIDQAYELWSKNKNKTILGEMTTGELVKEFKEKLNDKSSTSSIKEKYKNAYKKHVANINSELMTYIQRLRKKYKVYLLTDTIDIHDEYNKTRGIYPKFDKVFKSFEEHLKKPDKKAYLNVLKKINAKPYECVFIDDLNENIIAARKLGLHGIVYDSLEDLKQKLDQIL